MDDKFPFVAAVIGGVAIWIAMALLVQEYLTLTAVVLIATILVFRLNAWAFVGSFLTGLAIDFAVSGESTKLGAVAAIIVIGSLAQVVLSSFQGGTAGSSSFGKNMAFAFFGVVVALALTYNSCGSPPGFSDAPSHLRFVVRIFVCNAVAVETTAAPAISSSPLEFLNNTGFAILAPIALSPVTWAAVFASLSEVGFTISGRFFVKVLAGMLIVGLFGGLVLFLSVPIRLLLEMTQIASIPLNDPSAGPIAIGMFSMIPLSITVGTALGSKV